MQVHPWCVWTTVEQPASCWMLCSAVDFAGKDTADPLHSLTSFLLQITEALALNPLKTIPKQILCSGLCGQGHSGHHHPAEGSRVLREGHPKGVVCVYEKPAALALQLPSPYLHRTSTCTQKASLTLAGVHRVGRSGGAACSTSPLRQLVSTVSLCRCASCRTIWRWHCWGRMWRPAFRARLCSPPRAAR